MHCCQVLTLRERQIEHEKAPNFARRLAAPAKPVRRPSGAACYRRRPADIRVSIRILSSKKYCYKGRFWYSRGFSQITSIIAKSVKSPNLNFYCQQGPHCASFAHFWRWNCPYGNSVDCFNVDVLSSGRAHILKYEWIHIFVKYHNEIPICWPKLLRRGQKII